MRKRLGIYLLFAALLIPFCAGSVLIIMLSGAAGETPLEIAYVKNFFDLEKQSPAAQECLTNHMPTVVATLTNLLAALVVSWTCVCRYMGGAPYVAARLTSMVSGVMFVVGAATASSGMSTIKAEEAQGDLADDERMFMYHVLAVIGVFLLIAAALGYVGVKFTVKGGGKAKLGRPLLAIFKV
eukprot:SAG22_NODE_7741_length_712_cov_1.293638_1_plen_182_part_10